MSTIITVWNAGGKGKSSSILAFANELLTRFPNYKLIHSLPAVNVLAIDFRLVIEINGKIIAIESKGDPKTELEKRLTEIVNSYKPDIIICSSRTKGETVQAVIGVANSFNFEIIWTSTYQMENNHVLANTIKGKHILELVLQLGLI